MEAIETKQSKPARKHGTGLQLFKCGSPDRRHYCPGLRHCQHFPLSAAQTGRPLRVDRPAGFVLSTNQKRNLESPPHAFRGGDSATFMRQRWLSILSTAAALAVGTADCGVRSDAACLRQGRFGGARLILGVGMGHLAEGKLDARGRQARGREARWFALNYPCCLRWRQGCGGLCPHPLKGLVP